MFFKKLNWIKGTFISVFKKSNFETWILYIVKKVENWFFSKATPFNLYKKTEYKFF